MCKTSIKVDMRGEEEQVSLFVTVHAVMESQGGGYFWSITYLSEDKDEIRGSAKGNMHAGV